MTDDQMRIDALEKAVRDLSARLQHVEKCVDAQLMMNVQTDVSLGMKSKDVAAKWGVTPQFVTCVAPRKQFAPSMTRH